MILETGNLKLGVKRHPPIQYQVSSIKFQTLNLTTCPEYALLIPSTSKSGIAPVSGFFYWPNNQDFRRLPVSRERGRHSLGVDKSPDFFVVTGGSGQLKHKEERSMKETANSSSTAMVSIQGKEIPCIEYKGQRVVTFRMVDQVHEKAEGTANRTFNRHKKQFRHGEDYFKVPSAEMAVILNRTDSPIQEMARNSAILITEDGYYLLVKPFDDQLSWDVQRQMRSGYFLARQLIENPRQDERRQRALEDFEGALATGYQRGLMVSGIMDRNNISKYQLAKYYHHRMALGTQKEAALLIGMPRHRAEELDRDLRALGLAIPESLHDLRRKKILIEKFDQALLGIKGKPSTALPEVTHG